MEFELPLSYPALMGIINVTPDSFSDGGKHLTRESAIDAGLRMVEEGADIVDVGGESTRPGAVRVPLTEELERTIPVVKALASRGVVVSIDSRKPEVAKAALDAGATIVNDVGGLRDLRMGELCAQYRCFYCIMHMRGEPETMQVEPYYDDVVKEVAGYLRTQGILAEAIGAPGNRIWVDPGIGFGKTVQHNLMLLNSIKEVGGKYPVMIGASRKMFLGKICSTNGSVLDIEDRLVPSVAAQVVAQLNGARIIRAHDVVEAKRAILATAAIIASGV